MTANQLRTVGEALFGPRWQTDLARALGVSDRTMRRWIASGNVPDGVWNDIRKIAWGRQANLWDVLKGL